MARHRGHAQWSVLVTVLAASRERPEQVRWYAVLQSLQTTGRMFVAIVQLQPPRMILFRFLGCSWGVRTDVGTPATVSVMLRL